MYCGGGHLGFPIDIKNIKFVEDLPMIIPGQFGFNCPSGFREATAIHRLTLDPMGKCSNAFFSETTNIIKAKLYMNVHWMVLYKFYVFCSDMKFKMAARNRRFEFHIGTKNVKFVEDHPMNIHVQFGFNHICSFREEGI
jgi:hypothetical protein